MAFTPEIKQKIADVLNQRGAMRPCARCGTDKFILMDGYISPLLQQEPAGIVIGSPNVPMAATACLNCGNMSLHALGVLGLLSVIAPEPLP